MASAPVPARPPTRARRPTDASPAYPCQAADGRLAQEHVHGGEALLAARDAEAVAGFFAEGAFYGANALFGKNHASIMMGIADCKG